MSEKLYFLADKDLAEVISGWCENVDDWLEEYGSEEGELETIKSYLQGGENLQKGIRQITETFHAPELEDIMQNLTNFIVHFKECVEEIEHPKVVQPTLSSFQEVSK